MHIITTTGEAPVLGWTMPAGEFLIEDRNGAEIMLRTSGSKMRPYVPHYNAHAPASPKSILVIGTMGFGDTILITPCLRQLKADHPQASIHVACAPDNRQVFLGLPYVDGFDDYPLPTSRLTLYDAVFCLEGATDGKTKHMTDHFADRLGVTVTDRRTDLILTEDEKAWAATSFPAAEGRRRIGIQVQAGVRARTYPSPHLVLLVNDLIRKDWDVYLMGTPGEFLAPDKQHVFNLSRHGLTWRQSAAFLTTCDMFVGPDSSLLHAAGTLGVRAIGLFGPFSWRLRTSQYKSVFVIQGSEGCDIHPCQHAFHPGLPQFPVDQPCAQSGRCEVLASILPERVSAKIESWAVGAIEG